MVTILASDNVIIFRIVLMVFKGRLSQEDIDRMVRDAKEFR
jgi:hypothetical protein